MKPRKVTYVSMIHTDGTTTQYGIYRATLHADINGKLYINMKNAERIAVYEHTGSEPIDYRGYAEKYATADYPAFSWS